MTTRYTMTETEIAYIMPHVDGPTLQLWIQQGVTSEERSMIARAIAEERSH